jgi:hypothetical protein
MAENLAEIGKAIRKIDLFFNQPFFCLEGFIDLPVENGFYYMKKYDPPDHENNDGKKDIIDR